MLAEEAIDKYENMYSELSTRQPKGYNAKKESINHKLSKVEPKNTFNNFGESIDKAISTPKHNTMSNKISEINIGPENLDPEYPSFNSDMATPIRKSCMSEKRYQNINIRESRISKF